MPGTPNFMIFYFIHGVIDISEQWLQLHKLRQCKWVFRACGLGYKSWTVRGPCMLPGLIGYNHQLDNTNTSTEKLHVNCILQGKFFVYSQHSYIKMLCFLVGAGVCCKFDLRQETQILREFDVHDTHRGILWCNHYWLFNQQEGDMGFVPFSQGKYEFNGVQGDYWTHVPRGTRE